MHSPSQPSPPRKRTSIEILKYSKKFSEENVVKSWYFTLSTLLLSIVSFSFTFLPIPIWGKILFAILFALLLVRSFILYHDYLHGAILKKSKLANLMMIIFGIFILAPVNVWRKTHNHHHLFNSKLSNKGIGSYPLVTKEKYYQLSKRDQFMYMASRHPFTIFFGYISLFILDFNVKSIFRSPKAHWDSFVALMVHFTTLFIIYFHLGLSTMLISWTLPFMLAHGLGAYIFYAQHNFPGAKFNVGKNWDYFEAALHSTSYLKMGRVMNWFTGNIGLHHIHHVNHHIPFYRLKEAMSDIVELQSPHIITLSPKSIYECLKLKVWDEKKKKITGL